MLTTGREHRRQIDFQCGLEREKRAGFQILAA